MSNGPQPEPGLRLTTSERDELLALDIPLLLAMLDRDGFPRITPIWFL